MMDVIIRSNILELDYNPLNSVTVWYLVFIPINIAWFSMIQIVTWLYVTRITSLGAYMPIDNYLKYAPIIIGTLQFPNMIINLARLNVENDPHNYFVISSSIFSLCIVIIEGCMYLLLIAKLNFILEYRRNLLEKIGRHLKITCCVVILLELIMAGVRPFYFVDFSMSPIIYLLRIYIIIQFYSDLLVTMNKECKTMKSFQFVTEKGKQGSTIALEPSLGSTLPSEYSDETIVKISGMLDVLYKRTESPVYILKSKIVTNIPNFTFTSFPDEPDVEASIGMGPITDISDNKHLNLSNNGPTKRQSRQSSSNVNLTEAKLRL